MLLARSSIISSNRLECSICNVQTVRDQDLSSFGSGLWLKLPFVSLFSMWSQVWVLFSWLLKNYGQTVLHPNNGLRSKLLIRPFYRAPDKTSKIFRNNNLWRLGHKSEHQKHLLTKFYHKFQALRNEMVSVHKLTKIKWVRVFFLKVIDPSIQFTVFHKCLSKSQNALKILLEAFTTV